MILHFGCDIPEPEKKEMDCEAVRFTSEEIRIVKDQIRKNMLMINDYIRRIDLFVNQERYPQQEAFIEKLRARLFLLMEENDTFRKTIWKNFQHCFLFENDQQGKQCCSKDL
ncbi:MAG TPA: hypothetical protein PLL75_06660 [Candidatus Omnitrophota bacterium]|nr:hypothetical protein [Candidatus Omnitrophota bacterium]HPS37389.1 hypothetical protein [Candidatus Omnitrophota bacterium]